MELVSTNGKEKSVKEKSSVSCVADKVVVKASHPSLLDGSKQVESDGLEAVGNPSGLSMQGRMKEKILKDVTNKLEPGPKKFKPAWNGPRGGNWIGD